jgi:hypothetical protein
VKPKPLVRVMCADHGERTVASIEASDQGPTYVTRLPQTDEARRTLMSTLGKGRGGSRWDEDIRFALMTDPRAERWAQQGLGLPSWCRDCRLERVLAVGVLRDLALRPDVLAGRTLVVTTDVLESGR